MHLQIAEFTDSKMNHLVYEDFTCRIKCFYFGEDSCKLYFSPTTMSVCLQQATDFHDKILHLSTLHLYLQKNVCHHSKRVQGTTA